VLINGACYLMFNLGILSLRYDFNYVTPNAVLVRVITIVVRSMTVR
jgi:hypothetical protein